VEAVAAILQRNSLPGKFLSMGYSADEQAGLFSDPANPQLSQAQVPVFLARIATPCRMHEWTLDKARQDWYWGYITLGSGLTAKSVFDDWMWWCGELHLLKLANPHAAQATWISATRAEFENAITEARNWFDGAAQDGYRNTVGKLARVFGDDRVPGLFAPLDRMPIGTETVEADERLTTARLLYDLLKAAEEFLAAETSTSVFLPHLPDLLKKRSDILKNVISVRPVPPPVVSLSNIHTLRLDDKSRPLYVRIEQARLFAEYVEAGAQTIIQRVIELIADIDTDCAGLTHFPRNLFTLSLQTIVNILEGALQQGVNPSMTSTTEGTASSETLLHYLRSLQLDKTAERLRLLAGEAGVNIDNQTRQPFSEVSGHISSAYRSAKELFVRASDHLNRLKRRCGEIYRILDPLPNDYPGSDHCQEAIRFQQQLIHIEDAFEDLSETANQERERFRESARKGQFQAIRDVPNRLMNPIQSQLHPIGGSIQKIENTIRNYRDQKLMALNDLLSYAFVPLFRACQKTIPQHLRIEDIETLSLHDLQVQLDGMIMQWRQMAAESLIDTGLNVDGWIDLAGAITRGNIPAIEPGIQQNLIDRGILKMRLYFGEQG
jgi:hypothetical protein